MDVGALALALLAFDDAAVRVGLAEELVELEGELVGSRLAWMAPAAWRGPVPRLVWVRRA